mgnify:CR=1 FL=1
MNNRNLAFALTMLFLLSLASPISQLNLYDESEMSPTSARSTACSGDICLNEVMPNPGGADDALWPGGEWLELRNNGTTDVNLSGWKVVNSGSKTLDFDANTIVGYQANNASSWTISPGEFVVIARNGDNNFYLTNNGMTLTLYDQNGVNLHEATWSSVTSGKSYEQDYVNPTGNWIQTSSPSPEQINSAGSPPVMIPSDLIISEVMANPWPSYDNESWPGGEWVEVFNSGSSDIDLTGWSIEDAAGNQIPFNATHLINVTSSPSSYTISSGQHRIIAVNGTSPYGILNNGPESLTLKWPNGSLAQEISYASTEQGFSMVASTQSNGMWAPAAYPTQEGMNPMELTMMPTQMNDVEITEILVNATTEGAAFPDGEWIELHNTGSVEIDLMGWSILDGMGNLTFIDPSTLVFNTTQGSTMIKPDGRRLIQFTGATELWDNYNHIMLRDLSGQIYDTATYVTNYGEDVALIRSSVPSEPWTPAAWKTPGSPEPGSVQSDGYVRFAEILPDGVGSDSQTWPNGEWLELLNYGTTDIDVSGWKLQAPSRSLTLHEFNMPLQSDTIIPAGAVALIALNGTSSFYLKHTTGDSIGLLDMQGATVDTISWSKTVEGESLVAPNSTHAGVGPSGAMDTGDWMLSAWATPGELNPVWPVYNGSDNITMTEILPYCDDNTIDPSADWIEFLNTGNEDVNLSRWSIVSSEDDRRFMRINTMWMDNATTSSTMIAGGERALFLMDDDVLSGLGDSVDLLNPDGDVIQSASWTIETDCQTLEAGPLSTEPWTHTLWPTPGEEEPDSGNLAGSGDIHLTRLMPDASSSISSTMEFIEITNSGDKLAVLDGWTLRSTSSAGVAYDTTFINFVIQPSSAIILANDASAIALYEDGIVVELGTALNRSFYLTKSGAALQLLDPSGTTVDAVVYGNGPVDVDGWSGIALVEPITNLDNLIYLRGDGCGDSPDNDVVDDWHHRWSRLGGSNFCLDPTVTTSGDITPLIGPEYGLTDLLAWIDGANDSLEVHMYQLQEVHLVEALIAAKQRGVDVTVVMDYGDNWWPEYDLDANRGMATTMLSAGIDVYWFGDEGETPYAYIHSKVAVRDNESVWIGSGNWKSSSHPAPESDGNRDWGVIVDDVALATLVRSHLAFDESAERSHITPVTMADAPSGWTMPQSSSIVGNLSTPISGSFDATLLVCPDNCINELVEMLDSADDEILLSLQYLDMDWSYGWGENPIVEALENAALRGVKIRLILNGAYLDEDIQKVVDQMNEDWNFTQGYDTNAIVMSAGDGVTKLHNKGAIIDKESVLISSINWGDSALVRNREMGLLISSNDVAAVYISSWNEDWQRVNSEVDSDQDGLNDAWEDANGLNRTRRSVVGQSYDEGLHDADGDGLTNEAELLHGGDPLNPDTDGDCITDGIEVAWAQASLLNDGITDVTPQDALTKADADNDGENESDALGCDLGGIVVVTPGDNNSNTNSTTSDDDNDGFLNGEDECPDTEEGSFVDSKGCSSAQRAALIKNNVENTSGDSAKNFFLFVMIGALILSGGAYFILQNKRSDSEEVKDSITAESFAMAQVIPEVDAPAWEAPVLDASGPTITPEMMALVPGWSQDMVKEYLLQGWTMDQLASYYQEQVVQHGQTE